MVVQGPPERLGACEELFTLLLSIPGLKLRLKTIVFTRACTQSVEVVQRQLHLMATAVSEVVGSSDLRLLFQHVLASGNILNQGTSKGGAQVRSEESLLACLTLL